MSVSVTTHKPQSLLEPYVLAYWSGIFNIDGRKTVTQQVIPNGYVDLVLHLSDWHCDLTMEEGWNHSPDYTLIGFWSIPYEVRFRKRVEKFGIRFLPEGLPGLFGVPTSEFVNQSMDMVDVLGRTFRDFSHRLREAPNPSKRIHAADQFFIKQLEERNNNPSYLSAATRLIRDELNEMSVQQLSEKVYISPRQLEREFKHQLGVSPKMFMRIHRLKQIQDHLKQPGQIKLASLAHYLGYTDQAHFIKDFKKMTGVSPTVFLEQRHSYIHF